MKEQETLENEASEEPLDNESVKMKKKNKKKKRSNEPSSEVSC